MKQLALAVLLTLAIASSVHEDKPDELGIGTLNGQIFAVEETGSFHHARNATGYLISCEPPKDDFGDAAFGGAADACEYLLRAMRNLRRESGYQAGLDALLGAQMYVSLHRVREIPFQGDTKGFFTLSAAKGRYIVFVQGLVGQNRRCIWLMNGVQVGKTPVSIELSPHAIVGVDQNSPLTIPNLFLRTSEHL